MPLAESRAQVSAQVVHRSGAQVVRANRVQVGAQIRCKSGADRRAFKGAVGVPSGKIFRGGLQEGLEAFFEVLFEGDEFFQKRGDFLVVVFGTFAERSL